VKVKSKELPQHLFRPASFLLAILFIYYLFIIIFWGGQKENLKI
jgi:hypothetical protein